MIMTIAASKGGRLALATALAAAVTTTSAAAKEPTVPEVLAKTENADGVFELTTKGEIHHIQSGLVCPPTIAKTTLWGLMVYQSPLGIGDDVNCDYGAEGSGNAAAKVTIYATKIAPGQTVDTFFERYKAEVAHYFPDATPTGPAITMQGQVPDYLKDMRSLEYKLVLKGKHYQSDLIVVIKDGWAIEIRCTYLMDLTPDEMGLAANVSSPSLALLLAVHSIGAQPPVTPGPVHRPL